MSESETLQTEGQYWAVPYGETRVVVGPARLSYRVVGRTVEAWGQVHHHLGPILQFHVVVSATIDGSLGEEPSELTVKSLRLGDEEQSQTTETKAGLQSIDSATALLSLCVRVRLNPGISLTYFLSWVVRFQVPKGGGERVAVEDDGCRDGSLHRGTSSRSCLHQSLGSERPSPCGSNSTTSESS